MRRAHCLPHVVLTLHEAQQHQAVYHLYSSGSETTTLDIASNARSQGRMARDGARSVCDEERRRDGRVRTRDSRSPRRKMMASEAQSLTCEHARNCLRTFAKCMIEWSQARVLFGERIFSTTQTHRLSSPLSRPMTPVKCVPPPEISA
jgi:hypothetical protein